MRQPQPFDVATLRLAPDVGRIVVSMFAALARETEETEPPIARPTVGERSETPRA